MNSLTKSNSITPAEVTRLARPVFQKYGIRKVLLFGSIATGRAGRRSDIDLILIQETDNLYFERFDGILRDLYQVLPRRDLDIFIYTPEEIERIAHRNFIKRALHEGQIIYESG